MAVQRATKNTRIDIDFGVPPILKNRNTVFRHGVHLAARCSQNTVRWRNRYVVDHQANLVFNSSRHGRVSIENTAHGRPNTGTQNSVPSKLAKSEESRTLYEIEYWDRAKPKN
jgi:hypothetical protein